MKKITKRMLAWLCSLSMVLSMMGIVHASGTRIEVGTATFVQGTGSESVQIPLSLTENTGIAGMTLTVEYTEGLTLIAVNKGTGLSNMVFTAPGDLTANPFNMVWDGEKADNSNGNIVTLTFSVPKETVKKYSVKVKTNGVFDNGLNDVDVTIVNGWIDVTEKPKESFTDLTFADDEYTYDGTAKTLSVSGVPEGATVTYASDDFDDNGKAINAGIYNITATVKKTGYNDWTATKTLTIKPKELKIEGLTAKDKIYDGTDKAILSGGTLTGVVDGDNVSAEMPTEGKFSNKDAGNNKTVTIANITLEGKAASNYTLTQPTGLKANITPAPLSVKADDKEMTKGSALPTLTYMVTEGTKYEEDALTGALATKANGTKTGTFDITQGTLKASDNYKLTFTKGTLTVTAKKTQSATVSEMPEKTYGDDGFTVSVTEDKNPEIGTFVFESSDKNVAEIDENGNVTIKNAGETNIIVKRAGNNTYADFEKSQKLTVKRVAITVTAKPQTKKVGTTDPELTYDYNKEALVGNDEITGALKRKEGEAVGKYDILQGGLKINDNYDITYNKAIFEILDKTPQNITVADFGEKTYGNDAFKISVTPDETSKLETFTYASDNEAVATVAADGTITIKGAGEANITVTQAGNDDYAKTTVTKKLTVAKKALEIKVGNIEITYGEEIKPNISYNGFITGEDESVLTKPVVISGYSAKPNAGDYDVELSGAEAANYKISYTNAKLKVNKKDLKISELNVFDKAADETTAATINTSSLKFDVIIPGDDVTIDLENAVAEFESAAVGSDIEVNITGLALSGADAGNYNLTNTTFKTTANIKDSVKATDIAAQINAVSVVTDSTEIKLPNVPAGYKIVVKTSDNEEVIKADGTVAPVENDTTVKLTFSIVNENDETDVAETGEITVTVPASSKVKVNVTAGENGTVTGSGEYLKNSNVTVTATANNRYKFDGWYNGDTSVSTNASYTFKAESDITLVAKFSRKSTGGGGSVSSYTVKFETNGGSKVENVKVDKNKTVAEPTAPTKDGFSFAGWYIDKDLKTKYDFSEKVTKSLTLYAAWTEKKAEVKDDKTEPTTPENKITFTDVTGNEWFSDNVKYVFENGLMNGVTSTEFAPNDNLTRAMLVAILYRAEGEPAVNKSIPFADVNADDYFANAVIWAQQNGIVSGVSENEFAPNENITREQIATIVYRFANYKGYDTSAKADISAYADYDEISEYAVEAMQYTVESGLIKGKTETTLNPKDNATRAEIAAILQRFIEANK